MRACVHIGLAAAIATVTLALQSCSLGLFSAAPKFDVSYVQLEERFNGYLIRIVAHREIHHFEALVNRDNWLYITIAEASVDFENLSSLEPIGIIELIEVTQFETSIQIAMRLSRKIRYCDVIRDEKSNDIIVAVHIDWE